MQHLQKFCPLHIMWWSPECVNKHLTKTEIHTVSLFFVCFFQSKAHRHTHKHQLKFSSLSCGHRKLKSTHAKT